MINQKSNNLPEIQSREAENVGRGQYLTPRQSKQNRDGTEPTVLLVGQVKRGSG